MADGEVVGRVGWVRGLEFWGMDIGLGVRRRGRIFCWNWRV